MVGPSRHVFDCGAASIRYRFNIDSELCLALFEEPGDIEPMGDSELLTENLPGLLQVRGDYSLILRARSHGQ